WEIAWALTTALQATGRTDAAAWAEARPNLCEVECLRRLGLLAGEAGQRVYVVHLSTREAPQIVRQARADGLAMFAETAPHYLTLDKDDPRAMIARYNPAVKARDDREALWEALADGTIDCVASD